MEIEKVSRDPLIVTKAYKANFPIFPHLPKKSAYYGTEIFKRFFYYLIIDLTIQDYEPGEMNSGVKKFSGCMYNVSLNTSGHPGKQATREGKRQEHKQFTFNRKDVTFHGFPTP